MFFFTLSLSIISYIIFKQFIQCILELSIWMKNYVSLPYNVKSIVIFIDYPTVFFSSAWCRFEIKIRLLLERMK